jgi:ferredoxin-NADP reductase
MKLEEDKNASYLLISTWSGLAPILSMYKTLIKSWNYSKIVNIYGERYKETIVEDVLNLMKSFEKDNVKNYFYLSKQQEDGFYTWHVQDNLEEVVNFLKTGNIKVYMCWKPAMVDATEEKLISLWIKKENILFEKF